MAIATHTTPLESHAPPRLNPAPPTDANLSPSARPASIASAGVFGLALTSGDVGREPQSNRLLRPPFDASPIPLATPTPATSPGSSLAAAAPARVPEAGADGGGSGRASLAARSSSDASSRASGSSTRRDLDVMARGSNARTGRRPFEPDDVPLAKRGGKWRPFGQNHPTCPKSQKPKILHGPYTPDFLRG